MYVLRLRNFEPCEGITYSNKSVSFFFKQHPNFLCLEIKNIHVWENMYFEVRYDI